MLPLQAIALGLVIVGLRAAVGGYDLVADLVADPLGWLLVLVDLARLPEDLPRRGLALGAATLALLTAAPLWFPALRDPVADPAPAGPRASPSWRRWPPSRSPCPGRPTSRATAVPVAG